MRLPAQDHQQQASPEKPTRTGFTLIELIVSFAILLILSALIMALVKNSLAAAKSTACMSNLRQVGTIVQAEASNRGSYPPTVSHYTDSGGSTQNKGDDVGSLLRNMPCSSCPVAKYNGLNEHGDPISAYGANPLVMGNIKDAFPPPTTPLQISRPSEVILMTDGAQFGPSNPRALGFSFRWWGTNEGDPNDSELPLTTADVPEGGFWDQDVAMLPFRHNGKANILFCDGHVQSIRKLSELKQKNLYWNY